MARRFGTGDESYADDGSDPTAPIEDQVDDVAETQRAADVSAEESDDDNLIQQLVGSALEQSTTEVVQAHEVKLMRNPRQESVVQGMISQLKQKRATTLSSEDEPATPQQRKIEEGFEEYMLKDITESVAD